MVARKNLFISLAHSKNYAVLATSNTKLGVDIQNPLNPQNSLDPQSPFGSQNPSDLQSSPNLQKLIEKHHFSPEDRKFIAGDPDRFYQVWARKEAYIKLFGFTPLAKIPLKLQGHHFIDFKFGDDFGVVLTSEQGIEIKELTLDSF